MSTRPRTKTPRGEPEKPPAFQFYARAWLSSTLGMSHEVRGGYITLLAWSWDNGALPDAAAWRRATLGPAAARIWRALRAKWVWTRDGWINERLERQRIELASFTARAKHGAIARWADASHDAMGHDRTSTPISVLRTPKNKPAAPALSLPPFKVYAAIAKAAVKETASDDLGDLAEAFKKKCAQQGLPYDASLTTKALHTATRKRA